MGHTYVTPEMVDKMKKYAFRMRRKFPFKKPEQIAKMVQKKFRVTIVDEKGSVIISSNGTKINS